MGQGRLIVACDFGTSHFRAVVTEAGPAGELEVLGCAQEPSEGFQDGDFVDLGKAAECISRTMKALEKKTDIYVSGFTYNISGSHLRSVRATSQVPISHGPRPINEKDLPSTTRSWLSRRSSTPSTACAAWSIRSTGSAATWKCRPT